MLERDGERLLVVSRYALDCQVYNVGGAETSWRNCSLRVWLNNTFINSAFNNAEKDVIPTVPVHADENPKYNTTIGENTKDQIFLLSTREAKKYFASFQEELQCAPTPFARAMGCYVSPQNDCCWWWLRTPGNTTRDASFVFDTGSISDEGNNVGVTTGSRNDFGDAYEGTIQTAVRPAMWIDLSPDASAQPRVASAP